MKYVKFSDEDKIKFFDIISQQFYNANFGRLSKSDFELLMFGFYLTKMVEDNTLEDGTINYSKCSDYKISKDLGITQQRVRNLKVKKQLTDPIEYDWKRALAKITENARYDKYTQKIVLNIPDPNLYLEIQNFIEDNGAYIEKQLNSKILQLRAEYYIDLIVALEPENNRKAIKTSLRKLFKNKGKEDDAFKDSEIGRSLIKSTIDIIDVVSQLSGIISPGNVVGAALLNLIKSS